MLTYTSRFLLNALLGKTTWPGSHDRGIMDAMGEKPVAAQSTRDIIAIRRVRDRIDREYAQPLNVEGLARDAYMSAGHLRSEEHTSELQSRGQLVCRLLLEKK